MGLGWTVDSVGISESIGLLAGSAQGTWPEPRLHVRSRRYWWQSERHRQFEAPAGLAEIRVKGTSDCSVFLFRGSDKASKFCLEKQTELTLR